MFGDRFVKIISNFEIKCFFHFFFAIGFQVFFCRLLVGTPIAF
jgi:hypothetical protein